MGESFGIEGVPYRFVDIYLVARDWWREDDVRSLPGEESRTTVFVVDFRDGCRYFGYTRGSVFGRLSELMGGPLDRGSDGFVREHGRRMAYLVQCVASELERSRARELRDELVSQAPVGVYWADGATVTTSQCWLREGETDAQVMSFGEWMKTRENEAGGRFLSRNFHKGSIAHLHGVMRLYVNYFQPSFKLLEKTCNGSVVTKRYSPPATPCDRVIRHEAASAEAKAALSERRATLDPVALLHAIREVQSALAAIVSPELRPTPRGESLERFLARLPDRWREEQEQVEGKPRARAPHTWRTRKDPFEGVWCDVLGWLQEDPDASAVALLRRLQEAEPDRFSRAHLRTLQRRVQQWRGIMADKLVYAASGYRCPTGNGAGDG